MGGNGFEAKVRALKGTGGLVTHAQLKAAGFTQDEIYSKLRGSVLEPVGRKLYRVAGAQPLTFPERVKQELRCVEAAVASHRTAAVLHGLDGIRAAPLELTVDASRYVRRDGCIVHRGTLVPAERTRVHGIPVTTVERTLRDCAGVVGEVPLACALEHAWRKGSIAPERMFAALETSENRGSSGIRRLRRRLQDCIRRGAPMDSLLEVEIWMELQRLEMPLPATQEWVRDQHGHPLRVDFVWPGLYMVLEANGNQVHAKSQDKDADRQARLLAAGYRVFVVTFNGWRNDRARAMTLLAESLRAHPQRRVPIFVYE